MDEVVGVLVPAPTKADPAKVDPAKQAAAAAAKQAADAKKAAADGFAVCMAGCFDGKVPSPTDRQTCRLTCGVDRLAAQGTAASPEIKAVLGRFDTCIAADCGKPSSATNAATCRLTCAQAALAGNTAPLATTARECSLSCLEHTGDCEAACKGAGGPDDAATCGLQCLRVGERCLGRCEEDPSARAEAIETKPGASVPAAGTGKPEPTATSVPKQTLSKLPAPE